MKTKTKKQMVMVMGIVFNVIGALIAMTFSIPFYMDSIGTLFVAGLLGPYAAMLCGVLGSVTSGMIFDVYSFYYAPVQLLTGFFAGMLYHKSWLQGRKIPIGAILVAIPTSLVSAMISAGLFHGITGSASSLFVIIFHHFGMPLIGSIFMMQIVTDYIDKLLAIYLSKMIIERGHLYEKWGITWKDTAVSKTSSKEKSCF